MPTYDFKCKCGKTFTELLSITDRDKPVKCKCGKKAERTISLPNISGFDELGRSN